MSFIFSGLFWSGALILLGIGLILNFIFRTRIPFIRIFFALFFIYLGISFLIGSSGRSHHGHIARGSEMITVSGSAMTDYDVIFGQTDIDLTQFELKDQVVRAEVNIVFGTGRLRIDSTMPVRVEISAAFAEALMPDSTSINFGSSTYRSGSFDERKPYLLIKTSVVFGKLELLPITRHAVPQPDSG